MSTSALFHDLAWDSPLSTHLTADATAAMSTRGPIVHLGCRTALISRDFIARGQSVTGVDPSVGMLRRALRHHRLTVAVRADPSHTGLPAASASGVLVSNLIHTHPDPRAVLAEAVRVAKPGARIVLLWPAETASVDLFRRLDHRRGWGRPAAILADVVRRLGLAGVPSKRSAERLPDTPDALVHDLLSDPSVGLVSSSTIFECQRVVILQLRAAAPTGTTASAVSDATASETPFALLSHHGDDDALARVEEHVREPQSRRRAVSTRPGG